MFSKKIFAVFTGILLITVNFVFAQDSLNGIVVQHPVHIIHSPGGIQPLAGPSFGLTPSTIRAVYQLPSTGGTGTIAIIDAFDDANAQNDFNIFSQQYGLLTATASNFEIHKMSGTIQSATTRGWGGEISLDIEWAHAIAPNAKILLVEATTDNFPDIMDAVDYARGRSDVVAISMSLGSPEFINENLLDFHFLSLYGASFFASAGDNGTQVQYPAVSPFVIGVGGTSLALTGSSTFVSETAWAGSGGGLSTLEPEPSFQTGYGVKSTNGFRAVPDVSYNGASNSPVSIYDSLDTAVGGWGAAYGTSAGAPQWAAIRALGGSKITNGYFYEVAANLASYAAQFRDITSGTNGTPGFYTTATTNYDYVTGLGSPLATGLFATTIENWKEQHFDMDDPLHK